MKQIIVIKLAIVIISSLTFLIVGATSSYAQSCTGSITCKEQVVSYECDGGFRDGESCTSDPCPGGTCKTVLDYEYNTESCSGFPQYCTAGCYSGWAYHSGTCNMYIPPTPPPPPPTPPPTPRPPTRYGCSGSSCVVSSGGPYTTSNCNGACVTGSPPPTAPPPLKYNCSGTACVVDPAGPFTEPSCSGLCAPPPSVPPPPTCEPEHKYKTANIWVRVISEGNSGQTVAWKGPEGNNPIYSESGWSVQAPTTDANGNQIFGQYKSYYNGSVKTFDTTKNKIGSGMDISLGVANPGSHDTIEDKCGTERTVDMPNSLPHGEMWSNHFCSGGLAYETQNGTTPSKTNNWCLNDTGLKYWKEDDSGEYGALDCDGDPRAWAAKDRDGCSGGFMRYGGQNWWPPTETLQGTMHDQLVPILNFADPIHWADLSYDGYWSMQFQAWDEYDSFNGVHTSIVLTPPAGQNCKEVRWFSRLGETVKEEYANVQTLANGDCEIVFNPKSDGNLVVIELTEPTAQQSCLVQLEDYVNNPGVLTTDLTIDKYDGFNIHFSGLSTEPVPPNKEEIKVWIARDDYASFLQPNYFVQDPAGSPPPANRYLYLYNNTAGYGQRCFTDENTPCSVSAPVYSSAILSNVPTLPEGTYNIFCGENAGTEQCTGNPACTMNGGSISACTGYNDCNVDVNFPNNVTDHARLTVMCTPQCNNVCAGGPYSDGCGGTCPTGSQFGAPGAVTIGSPFGTQSITSAAPNYSYNVSWSVAETEKTNYFNVVTYPQGAYANIDAAYTAYLAGATDVYYKKVDAVSGQANYTTSVNTLAGQDWKMTLGVQARNISCFNAYQTEDYENYDLIGSVSGNINAVTSNICGGGTRITTGIYPDVQAGTTVTTSDDNDLIPNFSIQTAYKGFGVYGSIVSGQYSVSFLPFHPTMWQNPGALVTRLNIQNPDLSQAYVCAACNRESIFTCRAGGLSGTHNTTATDKHFYVQLFNLANEAWWQAKGGNAYGKQGLASTVPATCTSAAGCTPTIIANLTSMLNSAGVPMSNSTISNSGGYYSENDIEPSNGSVGNPRGQSTTANFSPSLENFEYFLVNADVDVPTSASNPGNSLVINTPITNATQFKTAFGTNFTEQNGEIITWVDNSLTIDLTAGSANWNVPAGEKWVVFVPGDLTLTGPSDHSQAAQQYLMRVQTGGFLAFIVKGDITFDDSLGYGFTDPNNDVSLASYQTPIVEGVFIASDTLIVKSNGGSTPTDYKFVGAGTFVGWQAVNLERDFDNGVTRKSLHNTSPTELFIYRPDFMANTPEFMKKSSIDWKEVN